MAGWRLRGAASVLQAALATILLARVSSGLEDPYGVHGKAQLLRSRQRLREEAAAAPRSPIEMEIVIARFRETDLKWLQELPDFYNITIYNKGGEQHPMPDPPPGRTWNVVNLTNIGREANTFAEHLVRRYETLAMYTILSQADPFTHNLHYLELLRNPAMLGSVQTMSRLYKRDGDWRFKTPSEVVAKMSKHPWYRSERLSTRTLNSVWYHDEGTVNIQNSYRREHKLEPGTNLLHHHFGLMDLPDWMPEHQEVGSFAFGGLVGFERSKALQHPKRCYELLLATTKDQRQPANAWLIERMWIMLFGGPDFRDV